MRKWLIGWSVAALLGGGGFAVAQIVSALPFQLQNNTVADATQVMANFNQILNGVNANAAKKGINSDITALLGLTTPLSPSQGGTTTWTGGASTGAANAQVVATVAPSTFSLTAGNRVVFKASFANTAKLQLNVAATGLVDVFRKTNIGPIATAGGEVAANDMVEVIYNGTQYQLVTATVTVGEVKDWAPPTVPPGWLFADGSCVSQTTYAGLFGNIGTGWGACAAGLFALPDYRGRVAPGRDDMGGSTAGRLTNAGSGCTGTTLALGCGSQNQSVGILQANLPSYTLPNTLGISNTMGTSSTLGISNTMGVSDTRTWITSNALLPAGGATAPGAGGITGAATSQQAVVVNSGSIALTGGTSLTGGVSLTGGTSITGSVTSGGSGTAITVVTLPPALVVNKIIKY